MKLLSKVANNDFNTPEHIKLGVYTGPEEVIEKMALLPETTTSCVTPFIQKAGITALTGTIERMRGLIC